MKHRRQLIERIKNNIIEPLTARVLNKEDIDKAFQFIVSGEQIEKALIEIRDEKCNGDITVAALHRAFFYPSKAYIIYGGLGGMGLQLAYWMTERGAR